MNRSSIERQSIAWYRASICFALGQRVLLARIAHFRANPPFGRQGLLDAMVESMGYSLLLLSLGVVLALAARPCRLQAIIIHLLMAGLNFFCAIN